MLLLSWIHVHERYDELEIACEFETLSSAFSAWVERTRVWFIYKLFSLTNFTAFSTSTHTHTQSNTNSKIKLKNWFFKGRKAQ
jgi:hypothetical protein